MKIVLAYSGGLDTSVLLTWLKDKYDAEMIAFCADVGQEEELRGLDKKAKRTGASKMFIDDLQEEFASDFIYPMMQAGAIYEDQYYLGTSIARPLIAKRMVEIAKKEKATAIAHGATGKGNDQVRFELTAASLAPNIDIIAPWRMEEFRRQFPGRKEMIDYWTDLLLSCADQLLANDYVDQQLVDEMKTEMQNVSRHPDAVFYYSFIQATATV